MIAGKVIEEILLMPSSTRSQWYKTIPPEAKEEAMKIVNIAGRDKRRAWWTPERRAERGVAHSGKTMSEDARVKISTAKIEYWKNPENRAKHSGENHPLYGKPRPEKIRDKISTSHIGIIPSKETRATMSVAKIEYWKNLKNRAKLSTKLIECWKDPEFIIKQKEAMNHPEVKTKISGENHYNWQGGISTLPYGPEFNSSLKSQIRERDNHTCQECQHTEEQLGYPLSVHHIDYDKMNSSPENLISLCYSCHAQTNFGRADWTEYFRETMEDILK